jgi:4-amino-4-deoxy-L-arabinose transferase-like glycosyltransferase
MGAIIHRRTLANQATLQDTKMEDGSQRIGPASSQSWLKSLPSNTIEPSLIFAVAAIPRCFVWWNDWALSTTDFDDYREHGAELFATGLISDPHLMPGYAVLTQLFGGDTGVILLDIGLSALTSVLVWWLAGFLFNDRLAAVLCGIGVALHPNLILTAASGLTEPSFTFFFLAALVLVYKQKFLAGSILLVVSILIRPSFDLLAPLLIFIFAVVTHRMDWKQSLRKVGIYAVCYIVLMAPWWAHNFNKYDSFVRLNLGDGYVFYSGNNPHTQTGEGIVDLLGSDPILTIADPLKQNTAMKRAAVQFIFQNPGRFFELSALRFLRFWHVERASSPIVYLFIHPFTLAFMGFFIFGFRNRWRETLPLVLCIVYLTAVHSALISSPRYQLPIVPIVILLGVAWTIVRLRALLMFQDRRT